MSGKNLIPIKIPTRIGFLSFMGDVMGCGVIRVITPYLLLNYLNLPGIPIHTQYFSNYIGEVGFYKNFSFLQFQRSATEQHLRIHRDFRMRIQPKCKIPLIYEIDDLLTDIPEWNFAHKYYAENIQHIEAMMRESNAIIVSTEPLKKAYQKYNRNIIVCENHLPKFIWGDIYPKHNYYKEGEKIRILWAGSQNHFKHQLMKDAPDGGDFGPKLMDFIRKTTKVYDWCFMGALPLELENIKHEVNFYQWRNTFEYPRYLKNIDADMAIAPLQKGIFNECKSGIKALEFTAIGIPGIYSRIYPYKGMTIQCSNEEEMLSEIEKLASDVDLRRQVWEKDYSTAKSQLWWEEDGNLRKYVDLYLSTMNRRLP